MAYLSSMSIRSTMAMPVGPLRAAMLTVWLTVEGTSSELQAVNMVSAIASIRPRVNIFFISVPPHYLCTCVREIYPAHLTL